MTMSWSAKAKQALIVCALGASVLVAGCSKSKPAGVAVRNADGSITNPDGSVTYAASSSQAQQASGANPSPKTNPDGSVTNADGSVTYPASSAQAQAEKSGTPMSVPTPAVSAAPTPAASAAPAPTSPAPEVASAAAPEATSRAPAERAATTLPVGTRAVVSLSQGLAASRNNVGDSFSGVLAQPITTAGGRTVYPRGTSVSGTVVAAKGRGRFKGAGALGIELTEIGGRRVSTSEYEKEEKGKGKRTGALVGGGAGLGALIGGLAGGGKGALIGGLAGAGAGTAGSAFTGNKDVVLPAESVITFRLTAPLTVR